MKDKLTQIQL